MANSWHALDVKASWVAVFLLSILWWLTFALRALFSRPSVDSSSKEDGVTAPPGEDTDDAGHRMKRLARHFRDGLLFLLAAVSIDVIAAGPYGATNALAWIFTSFWIIIGVLKYFFKWRRLTSLLEFLDLVLLIALISNAFAHAAVRSKALGA